MTALRRPVSLFPINSRFFRPRAEQAVEYGPTVSCAFGGAKTGLGLLFAQPLLDPIAQSGPVLGPAVAGALNAGLLGFQFQQSCNRRGWGLYQWPSVSTGAAEGYHLLRRLFLFLQPGRKEGPFIWDIMKAGLGWAVYILRVQKCKAGARAERRRGSHEERGCVCNVCGGDNGRRGG